MMCVIQLAVLEDVSDDTSFGERLGTGKLDDYCDGDGGMEV